MWFAPYLAHSFGLYLRFLGGKGPADVHGLIKHNFHIKTKIDS